MGELQRTRSLQMVHLETEYRKLFEQYNQLLSQVKTTEGMISLKEMRQLEQEYQDRLSQYAEKEAALRQNMEIVEQEMVNLQQMLEEK